MKNYVLLILLILLPEWANAQEINARKIAKAAFQKMTGGKALRTFELETTYEVPRQNPVELTQPNPLLMLLDSIMPTLPDSMQKAIKLQMDSSLARSYQDRIEMFKGQRDQTLCDITEQKIVYIRTSPNSLRGTTDTSRSVFGINKDMPFMKPYQQNPAYLLQLMVSDSTELHYTGSSTVDQDENHIVQVKIDGKWIDTYISKKNLVLTRIVIQQVDTDPLIGRGPEYYKDFYVYSDYKRIGGVLFPKALEEISSRGDLTITKKLNWKSVNETFPENTFKPEPTYEEKAKFKIVPLRDSLYVVVRFGNSFSDRSLLRITSDSEVDLFMEPLNHEVLVEKFLVAVKEHSTKVKLRDVYCSNSISSISSLAGLFKQKTHIIAPQGNGFMSEERRFTYNATEDSIWRLRKTQGSLITFDKNFERNDVKVFVINPDLKEEWEQRKVFYYIPGQKLIFYHGNPYWSRSDSQKPDPSEKELYDYVVKEKIAVKTIIYSESYLDAAPLEMGFEDLAKRVNGN